MRATQRCLDMIKGFECFAARAYLCPAQKWTCGYGHTLGVQPYDTCTPAQAERWLREDVEAVERELYRELRGVPLNVNQWDALVSLAFNVGSLLTKAPKMVAALHREDYPAAAKEFMDITRANGRVLPGLVKRRQAEAALFITPVSQIAPLPPAA